MLPKRSAVFLDLFHTEFGSLLLSESDKHNDHGMADTVVFDIKTM